MKNVSVLVGPAAKATVAVVTEISALEGNTNMGWLISILSLIPVIAQGINMIHSDKSLGDKTQLATDSLNLVIAGAKATVPASDQAAVDALTPVAQQTLAATLTAIHNASQPAATTA